MEEKITRLEAINYARAFGLDHEVTYCIDKLDMAPEEALKEWDIF